MKVEIDKNVVAYITGFFDGEGYIGINKKNLLLEIRIINTNLEILKRIKSVFRGNVCTQKEHKEYYKKKWVWQISDRDNLKFFLETMLPYSTVKKSQIINGLEFLKNTTYSQGKKMSYEERKYREMMLLKLKEPKHHIYTGEEIKKIDEQIKTTQQSQRKFDESVCAYISGFFDAEGCVRGNEDESNYLSLRTTLKNTYPYTLISCKQVFGGNVYKIMKLENLNWRQSWDWRIQSKNDNRFFLTKILSYSIIKKPQIELGLKFLETNNCQQKQLISDKLKEMKDEEYTDEEIYLLNKQIEEMNVDKLQHKIADYN